jgi:hypothetical protein
VQGEKVMRNAFDQVAIDSGQAAAVAGRLAANPTAAAEELFPELFAHKWGDPSGAHAVADTVAGGSGQWGDTKQLNHGGFHFGGVEKDGPMSQSVNDWLTRVLKYWAAPPAGEPGAPKHRLRGVDGYRLDHGTNLTRRFYEHSLTQLQAVIDKPLAFVIEDFNQGDKLRPYADAMEAGWYHELIKKFQASDVDGVFGVIDSDFYFETMRGGNHDEERVVTMFGGDMRAAGRYLCMLDLLGGWSTTVMGDEWGESKKVEFKHQGAMPPTLLQARFGKLPQANVELQLAMQRAGVAKISDPSLSTILHSRLNAATREDHILGLARHADDPAVPSTLVFANLANADVLTNTFRLDAETRRRIAPAGWYQARDLMAKDSSANVWGRWVRGQDLLDNGVYVKLAPYQIQALKLEKVG